LELPSNKLTTTALNVEVMKIGLDCSELSDLRQLKIDVDWE
jgi:hypothetical protein